MIFSNKHNSKAVVVGCEGDIFESLPSRVEKNKPGGKYFVKYSKKKGANIYSFDAPLTPVATVEKALGAGMAKVFYKDKKVYLFDREYKKGPLKVFIFK